MSIQTERDAAARVLSKLGFDGCEDDGNISACMSPPCPCRRAAMLILEATEAERKRFLGDLFGPEAVR